MKEDSLLERVTATAENLETNFLHEELYKDEQFYRDTESIAFPNLDDRQLAMLEPLGTRRILRRGGLVFKAGERDLGLTVNLRGELEVFEARDGQEQILATPGPRDFVSDVAMLMGTAAVASPTFSTRGEN
jgi:thioredoxin reductase (NADPH)